MGVDETKARKNGIIDNDNDNDIDIDAFIFSKLLCSSKCTAASVLLHARTYVRTYVTYLIV